MPDMIDAAQEADELFNASAIASRAPVTPIRHCSHCQWCADPMPPRHGRFCSAECRTDWDKQQARQALAKIIGKGE